MARKLIDVALFWAIVLIGEVHNLFGWVPGLHRLILFYEFPLNADGTQGMTIQWYVYQNAEMVSWVLFSVLMYRYAKHRTSFTDFLIRLFIFWKIADIAIYWLTYKTTYYWLIYLILVILLINRAIKDYNSK